MAKKRRRIDLKFVVISALVLMGLAVLAYVMRKTVFRPNPEKYMAAAKADIERGDWDQAIKDVGAAIRYARTPDPTTWIMFADVMSHKTGDDFGEFSKQWIGALNQALTIDPNNKTALRMMLEYQLSRVQVAGLRGAGEYEGMTRNSEKLLAIEPTDKRAQFISAYAVFDQKLSGIEINDPKRIDQAEQRVAELLRSDPSNADAAFLLARWRISQLWEQQRLGNMKVAQQRFEELEKYIDSCLLGGKDNPMMHFRMAQIFLVMPDTYSNLQDKATTEPAAAPTGEFKTWPPEQQALYRKRTQYLRRAFAELDQAAQLIKPEDENYIDIRSFYARQLERPIGLVDVEMTKEQVEPAVKAAYKKSEDFYLDILKRFPGERRIKLQYAKMISQQNGRREEALKLLEEPSPPNPRWIGISGFWVKQSEIETLVAICDLNLDLADTKNDRAEKQKLIDRVKADHEKLVAISGESWCPSLTIQGRMQLMQGDPVNAASTFGRALTNFSGTSEDRTELQYQMARTYMMTNQTGEAKKMLRDVISMTPSHFMARLQLAELLIREGNIKGTPPRYQDGAVTQIDTLERVMSPDNPMLIRLRLMTIDRAKEADKFKSQWAKIPETTPGEKFEKARLASTIDQPDEAIRLLESIRAEKPGSPAVAQVLMKMYLDKGQKDKAMAVIDEAIAKNPQEPALVQIRDAVVDPAAAQIKRREQVKAISDPLNRELAEAELAQDDGDQEALIKHLQAAEKLAPDNARIMSQLLEQALARKDFAQAQTYVDKLAKRNEDGANGQTYRVRLALAQGRLEEASDQAQKLTKQFEKFSQSWVIYGKTLQAQNKFEAAIAAYQQALDRRFEDVEALRGLIECNYALKNPGRPSDVARGEKATGARLYIEMGQKMFPFSQFFKELGLRWEMAYGDREKAIAPRMQSVKDHPESPDAWYDLSVAYLAAAEPSADVGASGDKTPAPANDAKVEAQRKEYRIKARDTLAQGWQKFPKDTRFIGLLIDSQLQLGEIDKAEKLLIDLLARPDFKDKPDTILGYAEFYVRANKPDRAEQVLREALQKTPDNIAFQARLGSLLTQQGKVDEALKVLEANSDNDFIVRQRVETMLGAGRIEDASKFIDTLLAKKPDSKFYTRLRANVDLSLGKLTEVRKAAEQILAADSNDVDGLYLRARANLMDPHGDMALAIEDLNRVVVLQPNASEARVQLADAYWRRGMPDDAIRTVQQVLPFLPGSKALRLRLFNMYVAANPPRWFNAESLLKETRQHPQFATDINFVHAEAVMWLQRKEPNKALNIIKDVIAKEPNNIAFQQTYLAILAELKDYSTLLSESQKQVTAHPDLWWTYQYRAIARNKGQNDRKGAFADLQAAMQTALKAQDQAGFEAAAKSISSELGPTEARQALTSIQGLNAYWQLVVASLLQQIGATPDALATVEKVMADPKLSPIDLVNALRIGGAMYMTSKPTNYPKAIEFYRRLVKEVPNDFAALNNLAYLLLEQGPTFAPNEAVTYSQRVLDLTRRQNAVEALPLVMDTHAWALINSGKPEEGISLLREALTKKQFAEGYFHLGKGFLMQKQPSVIDARRALDDAQHKLLDDEKIGIPADPELKSKIAAALDTVKQMQK